MKKVNKNSTVDNFLRKFKLIDFLTIGSIEKLKGESRPLKQYYWCIIAQ